jgi:glycosyltransferase involved in cell wall biosynthesis
MSIVGVLIGLMIMGKPFSTTMNGIAIVALSGIVVNNNIVLIDTFKRLVGEFPNLSKEEVIMKACKQRLRPILLMYEGFGFPVAEAMACGTPIISSNSSALPEIVQDFGQLYEPGNSDALKDCIENFYLNRSSFNDLAIEGSLYANETFNWEKIALDYEVKFLEAIERFNSC